MILVKLLSKIRDMKTKIDIRKVLSDGKKSKIKSHSGFDNGLKGLGVKILPGKS